MSLYRIQCYYDSAFTPPQCSKYLLNELFHMDLLDEWMEGIVFYVFLRVSYLEV